MLAPSPMQTAGRNGRVGLNTSPVKPSLKGKHLLPRESLYFTLLQGSALDLSTDCFGAKLEKMHYLPMSLSRKEGSFPLIEPIHKTGSWRV